MESFDDSTKTYTVKTESGVRRLMTAQDIQSLVRNSIQKAKRPTTDLRPSESREDEPASLRKHDVRQTESREREPDVTEARRSPPNSPPTERSHSRCLSDELEAITPLPRKMGQPETFLVRTEREGRKILSQDDVSSLIRRSILRAKRNESPPVEQQIERPPSMSQIRPILEEDEDDDDNAELREDVHIQVDAGEMDEGVEEDETSPAADDSRDDLHSPQSQQLPKKFSWSSVEEISSEDTSSTDGHDEDGDESLLDAGSEHTGGEETVEYLVSNQPPTLPEDDHTEKSSQVELLSTDSSSNEDDAEASVLFVKDGKLEAHPPSDSKGQARTVAADVATMSMAIASRQAGQEGIEEDQLVDGEDEEDEIRSFFIPGSSKKVGDRLSFSKTQWKKDPRLVEKFLDKEMGEGSAFDEPVSKPFVKKGAPSRAREMMMGMRDVGTSNVGSGSKGTGDKEANEFHTHFLGNRTVVESVRESISRRRTATTPKDQGGPSKGSSNGYIMEVIQRKTMVDDKAYPRTAQAMNALIDELKSRSDESGSIVALSPRQPYDTTRSHGRTDCTGPSQALSPSRQNGTPRSLGVAQSQVLSPSRKDGTPRSLSHVPSQTFSPSHHVGTPLSIGLDSLRGSGSIVDGAMASLREVKPQMLGLESLRGSASVVDGASPRYREMVSPRHPGLVVHTGSGSVVSPLHRESTPRSLGDVGAGIQSSTQWEAMASIVPVVYSSGDIVSPMQPIGTPRSVGVARLPPSPIDERVRSESQYPSHGKPPLSPKSVDSSDQFQQLTTTRLSCDLASPQRLSEQVSSHETDWINDALRDYDRPEGSTEPVKNERSWPADEDQVAQVLSSPKRIGVISPYSFQDSEVELQRDREIVLTESVLRKIAAKKGAKMTAKELNALLEESAKTEKASDKPAAMSMPEPEKDVETRKAPQTKHAVAESESHPQRRHPTSKSSKSSKSGDRSQKHSGSVSRSSKKPRSRTSSKKKSKVKKEWNGLNEMASAMKSFFSLDLGGIFEGDDESYDETTVYSAPRKASWMRTVAEEVEDVLDDTSSRIYGSDHDRFGSSIDSEEGRRSTVLSHGEYTDEGGVTSFEASEAPSLEERDSRRRGSRHPRKASRHDRKDVRRTRDGSHSGSSRGQGKSRRSAKKHPGRRVVPGAQIDRRHHLQGNVMFSFSDQTDNGMQKTVDLALEQPTELVVTEAGNDELVIELNPKSTVQSRSSEKDEASESLGQSLLGSETMSERSSVQNSYSTGTERSLTDGHQTETDRSGHHNEYTDNEYTDYSDEGSYTDEYSVDEMETFESASVSYTDEDSYRDRRRRR